MYQPELHYDLLVRTSVCPSGQWRPALRMDAALDRVSYRQAAAQKEADRAFAYHGLQE